MKLINEKYRALKPSLGYLTDEVVIAQSWKTTLVGLDFVALKLSYKG
ncbi:hypothetical protein [Pseudoalteromonas sp. 2CM36K]|nr:hypothetical protein [Pseudoalteromonas sp. 2CM36K]MCK8102396.1 hypothetical protein [Pseudoalteromonas sp. 2CM36K]